MAMAEICLDAGARLTLQRAFRGDSVRNEQCPYGDRMMVALDRPRHSHRSVAMRLDEKTKRIGIRLRGVSADSARIPVIAAAAQRVYRD